MRHVFAASHIMRHVFAVWAALLTMAVGSLGCCNITTVTVGAVSCEGRECSFNATTDQVPYYCPSFSSSISWGVLVFFIVVPFRFYKQSQLTVDVTGPGSNCGFDPQLSWQCAGQPIQTFKNFGVTTIDLTNCWNHTTMSALVLVLPEVADVCSDALRTLTVHQTGIPALQTLQISFSPFFSSILNIGINPALSHYTVSANEKTAQAHVVAQWDDCEGCQIRCERGCVVNGSSGSLFVVDLASASSIDLNFGSTATFTRPYTLEFDRVPVALTTVTANFSNLAVLTYRPTMQMLTITTASSSGTLTLNASADCDTCQIACAGGSVGALTSLTGSLVYPFTLQPGKQTLTVSVYLFGDVVDAVNYTLVMDHVSLALASLAATPGILVPSFDPQVLNYAVFVPQTAVDLEGTTAYASANVSVNGKAVSADSGGTWHREFSLNDTSATSTAQVQVYLIDQPQLSLDYTFQFTAVTLALQNLTLTSKGGFLTPAFEPTIIDYTATVPYGDQYATFDVDIKNMSMLQLDCGSGGVVNGTSCTVQVAVTDILMLNVSLRDTSYSTSYTILIEGAIIPPAPHPSGSPSDETLIISASAAGVVLVVILALVAVRTLTLRSRRQTYETLPSSSSSPLSMRTGQSHHGPDDEARITSPFEHDQAAELARARRHRVAMAAAVQETSGF